MAQPVALDPRSPSVEVPPEMSVKWRELDEVFEICSPDRAIIESARGVFVSGSAPLAGDPTRRWTIEPADVRNDSSVEWLVSGGSDSDSMIPKAAEDRTTALLQIEQDALEFLLRRVPHLPALHAALLARDGKGIVIVGPSFAGKSTLATALWQNGWSLMSDDIVFIDSDRRIATPAPRRVSLRFESRPLIGEDLWERIRATPSCVDTWKGVFFHPHELTAQEKLRHTDLAGIFFLARRDVSLGSAETRPLNSAKAAVALIPYALNVRNLPFVEALRSITPLAAAIPSFDLGRGELSEMVRSVESRVESPRDCES
jgi:hypothetical protein